ncbi:MAG: glycosyltransferase [Pyrinomonadaceae bacterium MAG19_C2-C3]|nr:glycosyltransferase [Pyrinomonadaceae bacterium MAG19_C2-C3]
MRMLFFSPYGRRNGAEMVLYNIIRRADRARYEMAVACGEDGDLFNTLPADVRRFPVMASLPVRAYHRAHAKLLPNISNPVLTMLHRRFKPDVWYINTIIRPDLLRHAVQNRISCIMHSHELEMAFPFMSKQQMSEIIDYPQLIIACSEAAANVLRVLGRTERIEVCYGMVELANVAVEANRRAHLRRELGIAEHSFVWAMSGSHDVNKDAVMFVRVANELLRRKPDTHFIWLGGGENAYSLYVEQLSHRLGISDRIAWLGARTDDYYDYLNVADGFVLTSKYDSFPLVMIEAAHLGMPIVSFDSGGVREFLRDGMGDIVVGGDVVSLIAAMERIMAGETFFDSEIARRRAADFDAPVQCARWESIMRQYFAA